ncbi:Acetate kinase [Dissostichus eleginoides]|uniref:Acetate kinase n=1 Tax=Dissostichus eleginoides TaxID=100907 RepID=A0AAD9EPI9_DISEL|nr:Acetate kinase [Dissostichus eleginoides]
MSEAPADEPQGGSAGITRQGDVDGCLLPVAPDNGRDDEEPRDTLHSPDTSLLAAIAKRRGRQGGCWDTLQ